MTPRCLLNGLDLAAALATAMMSRGEALMSKGLSYWGLEYFCFTYFCILRFRHCKVAVFR